MSDSRDELVEAVARAMWESAYFVPRDRESGWENESPLVKEVLRRRARAALEAVLDAGWWIVKGPMISNHTDHSLLLGAETLQPEQVQVVGVEWMREAG